MVRPLWLGDDIGALAGARGRVLSVLQVGYPFAPVTADPAGGAEQVLATLDRAMVAAGHRSLVIAPAGSRVAGELIAIPPARGAIDEAARARTHAAVRAAMAAALPRADVVHLHGIDFGSYAPPAMSAPVLATLHLPMPWYPPAALTGAAHLLPVSAAQAATAPPGVRLLPPIDNGVDLASFASVFARRAYVTCIGRVAPEKGFADAIDAAVLAGVPLLLAGVVFPYPDHRRYFDEAIRPRLSRTVRWLGPVAGRAKRRLIGGARALLNPSRAAETSSLVAMEAAAAGTPVIAYRSGALPHVVEHGRTGFIVDGGDVAGMAAAIREVDAIDPAVCRATAARRFDVRRTAAAYLDLYAALASGSVTPAAAR